MILKLKDKFISFCRWLWQECKDIKTFFLLLLVIVAVYSPIWVGYLLHAVFGWKSASIMASVSLFFWAEPFTHFFLTCIGITLFIKWWTEHRTEQSDSLTVSNKERAITYTKLFWLFLAGSIAGVIIEGLFCLIKKGHWETHVVSVFAPYNLLYGLGVILFYIGAVKLQNKPLPVQIVTMTVLATSLELTGGLLLRYGLGMRAWNYSNKFLNYKGIICLGFSVAWGIAAFAFAKLSPHIQVLLKRCTGKPWRIACIVLSIFIAFDLCMTSTFIMRWSERHYGISAKTEIQKMIDTEAPDDWMQSRFIEWRFLD